MFNQLIAAVRTTKSHDGNIAWTERYFKLMPAQPEHVHQPKYLISRRWIMINIKRYLGHMLVRYRMTKEDILTATIAGINKFIQMRSIL